MSPLFWFYGLVGLAYTAEAALATGVAAGAWAMRQGRVGALLSSAVRWAWRAGCASRCCCSCARSGSGWRGAASGGPGPSLPVSAWSPHDDGLARADAVADGRRPLPRRRPRALRVDGPRHDPPGRRLDPERRGSGRGRPPRAGCLPAGSGGGPSRGPARLAQDRDRAVFFALWMLPPLVVYVVVHLGQHGYLLTVLPACYLLVARALVGPGNDSRRVACPPRGAAPWRGSPWPGPWHACGVLHRRGPGTSEPGGGRAVAGERGVRAPGPLPIPALEPHRGRAARARRGHRDLRGGRPAGSSTRGTPCW